VKVLDFGLAKFNEPNSPNASNVPNALSMSPTITSPMMTGIGVLLGTAAYMAPEQAKGRPADKRCDVWAFGCVVYEMLTGRRAFEGEDVSDTLAAVLRGEPDWNALPLAVPPHIRAVVRSCLEKDRKARIPDISAARFLMDKATALAPPTPATSHVTAERTRARAKFWQAVAALLALTTVAGTGRLVVCASFDSAIRHAVLRVSAR
jgi:eukaryotic-like serine/threonine-protein kinase